MNCSNIYEAQEPVYLYVRRETLLFNGIGNPDDPYDLDAISSELQAYTNDVIPPFAEVKLEHAMLEVTTYPCGPDIPIPGTARVFAVEGIVSGTYTIFIYSPRLLKAFAQHDEFVGLIQYVDYLDSLSQGIPNPADFRIDIDLINNPQHPEYIGYTVLQFVPDDASDPMGPGSYFFVVLPTARIIDINESS